ncbi:uncharacterized protein [Ptychodera flava]|uniref:uncharacterized protein isoform X2 n=1 Tax=Ptychodera flava TaxID=63121 RepID=UPI00396A1AFB
MLSRLVSNPRLLFRRLVVVIFVWLLYLVWMGPISRSVGVRKVAAAALTPTLIKQIMTSEAFRNVTTWAEFEEVANRLREKSSKTRDEALPYLLPVFPENKTIFKHRQYGGFKDAIAFSVIHNRTIVQVPFMSDDDDGGGKLMTSSNKIFDEDSIRQLVPTATLDQFKRHCEKTDIQVVYLSNKKLDAYGGASQLYREIFDIALPGRDELPKNPKESIRNVTPNATCLALYDPEGYIENDDDGKEVSEKVESQLLRAPVVSEMLDTVTSTVSKFCENDKYLAMHWRNKTSEWCEQNSQNRETCTSLKDKVVEVTEMIASTVANMMRDSKIKCVYVAYPTGSEEVIKFMNEKILARRRIMTQSDLSIRYPENMEEKEMKLLLEEEICLRAETFIGWPTSTWSQSVVDQRRQAGKESLFFNELPYLSIVKNDYGLVFDIVFS